MVTARKNAFEFDKTLRGLFLLMSLFLPYASSVAAANCKIQAVNYEGWQAQEISNAWVKLTIVPQVGGRLMQVTFAGHPYLFVNDKLKGKYIPPSDPSAKGHWFNYGGDKIWPMPEGSGDDQHWPGPIADVLDNGEYKFTVLSQGENCAVKMEGPADPMTGLQYSREIRLAGDSPKISFHAVMRNATGHAIRWGMQSVSQYDTTDRSAGAEAGAFRKDFWAFTPANPQSAYLRNYFVRAGLADDPSFEVKDGLFRLHWMYLMNEVWVDSPGDWLAVVDGASQFAMVERFHVKKEMEYPARATVIFYKNGPSLQMDAKGIPQVKVGAPEDALHYMEAELNSPVVDLAPGETYAMDTEWEPTRSGTGVAGVTSAGIVNEPLKVSDAGNGGISIEGTFGVFRKGAVVARMYDRRGLELPPVEVQKVSPDELVKMRKVIAGEKAARISLHVVDERGSDMGSLGEGWIGEKGRNDY